MLMEHLVSLAILPDNVRVILVTQGPNAVYVQAHTMLQVVCVRVSKYLNEVPSSMDISNLKSICI